jgi:ribosomal 50S subunit-recycling heat shock protein
MRLDKFLKVSRILKRRTLAAEAAKSGKVLVAGREVKPAYQLKIGDIVEIKFGNGSVKFSVNELKETVKKEDAEKMYTVISEEE